MQRRNFLKWISLLTFYDFAPVNNIVANTTSAFDESNSVNEDDCLLLPYWIK